MVVEGGGLRGGIAFIRNDVFVLFYLLVRILAQRRAEAGVR